MSTRCYIGIKKLDGTVEGIYCHHDGYISYVGVMLEKYYKDVDKVNALLKLGDLSSLGTTTKTNPKMWDIDYAVKNGHDYNSCVSYKDRGETNVSKRKYLNETEFLKKAIDGWAEYVYLFDEDDKYWKVSEGDTGNKYTTWKILKYIIQDAERITESMKEL